MNCELPVFELMGWIVCAAGWEVGQENSNGRVRFVKAHQLHPMSELLDLYAAHRKPASDAFPGDIPMRRTG